jgi:hypothetical protein
VGLDDQSDGDTRNMRAAERFYLLECGVELPAGFQEQESGGERPGGEGAEGW